MMDKNVILRAIVDILDELHPHISNINENGVLLGDVIYQLECFIDSEFIEKGEDK